MNTGYPVRRISENAATYTSDGRDKWLWRSLFLSRVQNLQEAGMHSAISDHPLVTTWRNGFRSIWLSMGGGQTGNVEEALESQRDTDSFSS